MSVLMTLSDLERSGVTFAYVEGSHFFTRVYLITLEPFDLAAEHMSGRAHFYGVSHTPLQGGGAPVLSNFWGYLLFLRTSFDAELPNLMWEGLVFRGSVLSQ